MQIRKFLLIKEVVLAGYDGPAGRSVTRAAAAIVLTNPFAGRHVIDLSELIEWGPELVKSYLPETVAALPGPVVAYGKAAIVGVAGDIEHAAALLHPKLGAPMREVVGGGESIIPSTGKVGSAGTRIDVPLCHKDNVWSFNELDTLTVGVEDAPRPNEILVVLAVSDGGRPDPRVGAGRQLI